MNTKKRLMTIRKKMAKSRIIRLLLSNRRINTKNIKPIVIYQCGLKDGSLNRGKKRQEVLVIQQVKELDDSSCENTERIPPPVSRNEENNEYNERNQKNDLSYDMNEAKSKLSVKDKCSSALKKYNTIKYSLSPKLKDLPSFYPLNVPKSRLQDRYLNRYFTNLVKEKSRGDARSQLKSLNDVKSYYKDLRSKGVRNTVDAVEQLIRKRRSQSDYRSAVACKQPCDYLKANLKRILKIRLNPLNKTFDDTSSRVNKSMNARENPNKQCTCALS
eukprot:TRINITY_DN5259_c0_g1_i2.p1 TRINITY_DN5259_c0_g1~~TRINITY_DN5259_c0_g1_i2.p1  ORF type:complete len:273 (+),score=47.44 TRINITY_DN5259_c0_g1_i2:138-956(+)